MDYEKPQPKNPHRLTVNQHIIPKSLISGFCNQRKQVMLYSKRLGKIINIDPAASIFCGKRVWDQRSEWVGKQVEDLFSALVKRVLHDEKYLLSEADKLAVAEFYGLRRSRHRFLINPIPDYTINARPAVIYDIDGLENLESNHIFAIRGDGSVPGRLLTGMQIGLEIDRFVGAVRNKDWGILRTSSEQFIFPDTFGEYLIVPISPAVAIAAGCKNTWLSKRDVEMINNHALESYHDYYFAENFSALPASSNYPHLGC